MKRIEALLVLVALCLAAGCATGNSRSSASPKSSPASVSVGGESRVRTNFFTR